MNCSVAHSVFSSTIPWHVLNFSWTFSLFPSSFSKGIAKTLYTIGLYVESIFIFFMGLSIIFNGTVSMQNKFYLKQTNSSLFATKIFFANCFMFGTLPAFSILASTLHHFSSKNLLLTSELHMCGNMQTLKSVYTQVTFWVICEISAFPCLTFCLWSIFSSRKKGVPALPTP